MKEPQSELVRYAFGYSDKKPTFRGTWLPIIFLIVLAFLVYMR